MLNPDFITDNLSAITLLTEDLHTAGIEVLAKQLRQTLLDGDPSRLKSTAENLQLTGLTRREIEQITARVLRELKKNNDKYLREARKEIRELFEKAGVETLDTDNKVYVQAGLKPLTLSGLMRDIINAAERDTLRSLTRLTGTTAINTSKNFEKILSDSYLQVQTGVKTYTKALSEASNAMIREGIKTFDYPSGHSLSIETAIILNIRTATANTAKSVTHQGMIEQGASYVDVTAHSGARDKDVDGKPWANHRNWQGRQYYYAAIATEPNIDEKKYPDFNENCGIDKGDGLGIYGFNCSHSHRVFFPGITAPLHTPEELAELNNKTVAVKDKAGNLKQIPIYEATQEMRRMERRLRRIKREIAVKKAAGLNADIKPLRARQRKLSAKLRDYVDTANTAAGETVLRSYPWRSRIYSGDGLTNAGSGGIISTGGDVMNLLPNADKAVLPIEKFTEYALNPLKQKDKSIAFEKYLGYNLDNYQKLIDNIKANIKNFSAEAKPDKGYGQRYKVVMELIGENGMKAKVLTAWIVDKDTGETRLISLYVDE